MPTREPLLVRIPHPFLRKLLLPDLFSFVHPSMFHDCRGSQCHPPTGNWDKTSTQYCIRNADTLQQNSLTIYPCHYCYFGSLYSFFSCYCHDNSLGYLVKTQHSNYQTIQFSTPRLPLVPYFSFVFLKSLLSCSPFCSYHCILFPFFCHILLHVTLTFLSMSLQRHCHPTENPSREPFFTGSPNSLLSCSSGSLHSPLSRLECPQVPWP